MKKTHKIIIGVLIVVIGAAIYLWSDYFLKAVWVPQPKMPTVDMPPDINADTMLPVNVLSPTRNQVISSPLIISGQARGQWYFEATFPVTLKDSNGKTLAESYVTAEGDWMTTDYVPFTTTLTFSSPTTKTGQLIFQNSNPSGLPNNAQQISVPVRFE